MEDTNDDQPGLCGCGRRGLYIAMDGMGAKRLSCNEHSRCPTYRELLQKIDKLEAEARKKFKFGNPRNSKKDALATAIPVNTNPEGPIRYDFRESSDSGDCKSKYHREIRPGIFVDVYDVLLAFGVTCPATAHAIKKLLAPGKRGTKNAETDLKEAAQSISRAIEMVEK